MDSRSSLLEIFSAEIRCGSAVVASDVTLCSKIGRDILENKGGSAVDAAIATLFSLGVGNLHGMGIGGGFIATIYDSKTQSVSTLDARETAPGLSRDEMYYDDPDGAEVGSLSIGVPGEVKGYMELHRKYGRLPWADLVQPAIDLCETGFPVPASLQRAFQKIVDDDRFSEDLRAIIYNKATGKLYKEGEVLHLPRLAKTLRTIAKDGGEAFYSGSLAQQIIEDIREQGGILTEDDLRNYQAKWRTPMTLTFQSGHRLFVPPSPSGGPLLALMLNILKGYDFDATSISTLESNVLMYHRMTEAMKFAFAHRAALGDPDFTDVTQTEDLIMSPKYGEDIRMKIDDSMTYSSEHYGKTSCDVITHGTSHLSLVDSNGNAVSVTSSINCYGGSTIVGGKSGVIFNNALADFSRPNVTHKSGYEFVKHHTIQPGKRTMSAICPAIVLAPNDNTVRLSVGAAGASKIPSAVMQVTLRCIELCQSLGPASDAPRIHHQLIPNHLFVENRMPQAIVEGLKAKGHEIVEMAPRESIVQSVLLDGQDVVGLSDDRKGGEPDGY